MSKAIVVEKIGAPSVMKFKDIVLAKPGKGKVTVKARAIGVNFIDIYQRTGLYPMPLPFTPGGEMCGEVTAIGAGVKGLKIGDRVACGTAGSGCYAEEANIDAGRLVKVPSGISDDVAAAMMLAVPKTVGPAGPPKKILAPRNRPDAGTRALMYPESRVISAPSARRPRR